MDKALKQRLVGASVLIILAVIVLPMLLSGRSDRLQQESRQIELPAKPAETSFETRRFPIGVPGRVAPVPGQQDAGEGSSETQLQVQTDEIDVVPASSEKPELSVPREAALEENPVTIAGIDEMKTDEVPGSGTNPPADTVEKPPAVTSITLSSGKKEGLDVIPDTGGSSGTPRYLVQVGSFSSEKNANALAKRLRADKLPVLMDVVDRAAGRLHRVRVGPYAERSDADAVVSSLRSSMKDLTPRVLDLRPAESAPVSTPSDPLVRWVVQVGSFGSAKSADTLVAKLRLSGLTAFSEKVTSASGIAYKVRIGPEIDRNKATELARKVKAEHNLDGFVTTQE